MNLWNLKIQDDYTKHCMKWTTAKALILIIIIKTHMCKLICSYFKMRKPLVKPKKKLLM